MGAVFDILEGAGKFLKKNQEGLLALGGIGANLYSGYKSREAAEEAAEVQQQAAERAVVAQRPYAELGDQSAGMLQERLGNNSLLGRFSPSDLVNEPGYQFELAEGNKAIDRAAGARGGRYSGATLKDLQRFGQGLAQQNYSQAYNRDALDKQRQYKMLSDTVRTGQGATGAASNYGIQGANARSAGIVGGQNALTSGYTGALNAGADYVYGREYPSGPTYRRIP